MFKFVLFASDVFFYFSKVKQFLGKGQGMDDDLGSCSSLYMRIGSLAHNSSTFNHFYEYSYTLPSFHLRSVQMMANKK